MTLSSLRDYLRGIQPQALPAAIRNHMKGACALGGAAGAIPATQAVVSTLGFTAGGITGGSAAASMMSSAAIANGGGVAAGSLVSVLQSVGTLGVTSLGTLPVLGLCATGACLMAGGYAGGKAVCSGIAALRSKL